MKISVLLPYKENFSPEYPGAVSLFVNDTLKYSKFKKDVIVYGSTNFKNTFNHKYQNLVVKTKFFKSQNRVYVEEFLKKESNIGSDLIEIHNRPIYIKYLDNKLKKK